MVNEVVLVASCRRPALQNRLMEDGVYLEELAPEPGWDGSALNLGHAVDWMLSLEGAAE